MTFMLDYFFCEGVSLCLETANLFDALWHYCWLQFFANWISNGVASFGYCSPSSNA